MVWAKHRSGRGLGDHTKKLGLELTRGLGKAEDSKEIVFQRPDGKTGPALRNTSPFSAWESLCHLAHLLELSG